MPLLINLAGIGARATGLGVYASTCGHILEGEYVSSTLHNGHFRAPSASSIDSPESIALGAGKLASLRRYRFLSQCPIADDTLAYSPSHHYLPGARHQILTVADLISLHHPAQHPLQWAFFRTGVAARARIVAAVFTISQSVKAELQAAFDLEEHRIHVVTPAIDTNIFNPAGDGSLSQPPSRPFLFCVGGRFPHKNVHELLERHSLWRSDYSLKIASCSGAYRTRLKELVLRLGLQRDVDILGYVDQSKLLDLYRHCAALVYPSKTEGFGIPPLEALACGSPVVVSDIPVHREVCGDAAIYVTLGSSESWAQAFIALANRDLVRTRLRFAAARLEAYSPAAVRRSLVSAIDVVAQQEKISLVKRVHG